MCWNYPLGMRFSGYVKFVKENAYYHFLLILIPEIVMKNPAKILEIG